MQKQSPMTALTPEVGRSRRSLLTALVFAAVATGAQSALPESEAPQLVGRTFDGRPFSLAEQRGKVVMVVFWSTGCAVCRDKLPELRANYAGWAGRPFELVTVATDERRQDALDYDRLIARIVPAAQRFPSLWRGEPGHRDGFGAADQLPAAYVIDREGRLAARFVGRIPAEAWDQVAELMP